MLKEKIDYMLEYIEGHKDYLELNHKLLDIHEGNLLPYVDEVLQKTLSPQYYDVVKEREIPINILQRLISKLAKVYNDEPIRSTDESTQELVDFYVKETQMDAHLDMSNKYSELFKGFALEPYMYKGSPRVRAIPFDRFLVIGTDIVDPTEPTIFIKMMGCIGQHDGKDMELYYAYTDDEFLAFTSNKEVYYPAMQDNDGVNPLGVIPFVYGNRSLLNLLPTQESDLLPMSKQSSIQLSDMAGAMVFQMFSVVFGIDIDVQNAEWSPNALWSIKSDAESDKAPQIGTLTPTADTSKTVEFIKSVLSYWFTTKGLSTAGIDNIDSANFSSGISKAIDEMDASDYIAKSMKFFEGIEKKLWDLIAVVHNNALDTGDIVNVPAFPQDFSINVVFTAPEPQIGRKEEVETISLEVDNGFMPREVAIARLYPELSEDERAEWIAQIDKEQSMSIEQTAPETETETDGI